MSDMNNSVDDGLFLGYPALTSQRVKYLSGRGLKQPEQLSPDEIQELCAAVLTHIQYLLPPVRSVRDLLG